MKIILPYHLGSGNRGCEGIARGIAKILNLNNKDVILHDISLYDYESDKKLGLDKYGTLRLYNNHLFKLLRYGCRVLEKIRFPFLLWHLMSNYYLWGVTENDVVFITGGDIYCYDNAYHLPNMIIKKAKKRGIKTVLYGVSMEKKFLNDRVISGLKLCDCIITRETISSETLESIGLKNSIAPDPAFSLEPEYCDLPDYFSKENVVGINFSRYTDTDGYFKENMTQLIKYLLANDMEVCLIPHVFWKEQDDRVSMNEYIDIFGPHVHILDSEKLSYLQIRYIISKCRYFIGGRTHSVISAYCTNVPCIALGYSVKARGIAKDIGMPDFTVVDSKNLKNERVLVDSFKKLQNNVKEIDRIYQNINAYKLKAYDSKEILLLSLGHTFESLNKKTKDF